MLNIHPLSIPQAFDALPSPRSRGGEFGTKLWKVRIKPIIHMVIKEPNRVT